MRLTVSLLCLSLASWGAAAAPILASSDGPVRGANADGVERFLGIPYAAPPVAEQRWQPPGPVKTHPAVLEATRFGNDCIQNGIPYAGAPKTSEDCLYLNIWRPAGAMHLPIMVYVFGGGFNIGSGAWAMVDGAGLARRGVVLVNFNYRLGKLGYFAHPALTRAAGGKHIGNFGLLDQIAALRWVKRNAKALGGDPGDITIFGESTGGTAVEYLMTAPAARGLFQRAIVESSIGTLPMPSFAEAEKLGERAAAGWGVADADPESLRHVPGRDRARQRDHDRGRRHAAHGRHSAITTDGCVPCRPHPTHRLRHWQQQGRIRLLPRCLARPLGEAGAGLATGDQAL